jgi:hypothetical protein
VTQYDRRRPETSITSWAATILVVGYIVTLASSPGLPANASSQPTCTVIVDCLKQPVILPTNSVLHRAVVVVLKSEVKFLDHLLHRFAVWTFLENSVGEI